jgi:hypothetical protein
MSTGDRQCGCWIWNPPWNHQCWWKSALAFTLPTILTELDVRRIVREEIERATADKEKAVGDNDG